MVVALNEEESGVSEDVAQLAARILTADEFPCTQTRRAHEVVKLKSVCVCKGADSKKKSVWKECFLSPFDTAHEYSVGSCSVWQEKNIQLLLKNKHIFPLSSNFAFKRL